MVQLGGLKLALDPTALRNKQYAKFTIPADNRVDLTVAFQQADAISPLTPEEIKFRCDEKWNFGISHKRRCFEFYVKWIGAQPLVRAEIDRDCISVVQDGHAPEPGIGYPEDQILFADYLSRQKMGLIAHASAVKYRDHYFLFMGASGDGKSTMAEIWHRNGGQILNDDRLIIRKPGRSFRLYATPWHGTYGHVTALEGPLRCVYILKHAGRNYVRPITGLNAVTHVFQRIFPTFWDGAGIEFALDYCHQIVNNIPIVELGFVPNDHIIDFILNHDQTL